MSVRYEGSYRICVVQIQGNTRYNIQIVPIARLTRQDDLGRVDPDQESICS